MFTREPLLSTVRHFDNRPVPLWTVEYRSMKRRKPYATKSNVGSK